MGWIFFNASSGYEIVDIERTFIPQLIALNTFIAPATSALTFVLFEHIKISTGSGFSPQDPGKIMNAILAGLVAITAPCNNVEMWAAAIIGVIGCFVYMLSTKLLHRFKIDDPIEASQIHGFTGFWGCLAVGIFDLDVGLIYSGSFDQLQIQLVGATACMVWSMLFCYFFFSILSSIKRFRVAPFYEIIGIDLLMHASVHDL